MTMTPVYLLKTPGNTTIEISQDELRSLLGKIEADLHRSKVYCRAMATLQNLLGSSAEQVKSLLKSVSREAIGLAFQEFIQQHQLSADISQQTDNTTVSPTVEQDNSQDLAQCLTNVKLHPKSALTNTSEGNLDSESKRVTNRAVNSATISKYRVSETTGLKWLNQNQKSAKIQQAKQQEAEQRLQSLCQIGQQLRQARESQSLSLKQLQVYTHMPIYQMEALENGKLELLPEDVFVRGFIRLMGNALGLDGIALAASLPAVDTAKSVLPSWYRSKNTVGLGWGIQPIHLYLGYTALVAGAVGGLSLMSQQANSEVLHPDVEITPPASVSQSAQKPETIAKPGLKSTSYGVIVGPDISPPEAL
ncbi:MAG: helix-turn-helix domain-containing protein [Gloeotrichia echinulata DVL01]|jgi:cytoskeleton protein RodZ|nr:helix-turn-helix domain-containing protein [Gloeotrichia echinulata DEX184]